MQDLQEIFNRIAQNKKELKDLRQAYKDALLQTGEHQEIVDQIKTLRERKKQVEQAVKDQFASEFIKMDDIKIDMESDAEMLSDIALNKYVKGETVAVTDEYENEYEPVFNVKFKKVK